MNVLPENTCHGLSRQETCPACGWCSINIGIITVLKLEHWARAHHSPDPPSQAPECGKPPGLTTGLGLSLLRGPRCTTTTSRVPKARSLSLFTKMNVGRSPPDSTWRHERTDKIIPHFWAPLSRTLNETQTPPHINTHSPRYKRLFAATGVKESGAGPSPGLLCRELHFPEGSAIRPLRQGARAAPGSRRPLGNGVRAHATQGLPEVVVRVRSAQAHFSATVAGLLLCGSRSAFVGGRSGCSRIPPTVGRSVRARRGLSAGRAVLPLAPDG